MKLHFRWAYLVEQVQWWRFPQLAPIEKDNDTLPLTGDMELVLQALKNIEIHIPKFLA